MPNPEQIFTDLRVAARGRRHRDQPRSTTPGSRRTSTASRAAPDHGIHLLGWTGDYNDTDNFVGVFFGRRVNEWGFDNPELFAALTEARGLATAEEQEAAYEAINEQIMEFLPGVPLAHPVPTLAFARARRRATRPARCRTRCTTWSS